jgi:cobalt/nickel transport system ATP-binding protein
MAGGPAGGARSAEELPGDRVPDAASGHALVREGRFGDENPGGRVPDAASGHALVVDGRFGEETPGGRVPDAASGHALVREGRFGEETPGGRVPDAAPDGPGPARRQAGGAPLIELSGVTFSWKGRPPVLDGLDLLVCDGDKVALTGGNGAGKTTLLSIVMGLVRPSAGTVSILGMPMLSEKDFRKCRHRLGFVFQDADDQLFCPTVADDVAFGPLNLGASPGEAARKVDEVLATLGMEGFRDRVTHDLSGGEKRLVAVGTALALDPRMLILDEPTNFLDRSARERLLEILFELDLPCLVVSHDFDFLKRICTRHLELRDGKIRPLDVLT